MILDYKLILPLNFFLSLFRLLALEYYFDMILLGNKKILFFDSVSFLDVNAREIEIHKLFQVQNNSSKYYLITNIGIFIARLITRDVYKVTDLFLETTPGRLIFSINFKNSIQN